MLESPPECRLQARCSVRGRGELGSRRTRLDALHTLCLWSDGADVKILKTALSLSAELEVNSEAKATKPPRTEIRGAHCMLQG
jgi:hypothetical protein